MPTDHDSSIRLRDLFPGADFLPAGCDPRFTTVRSEAEEIGEGDLYIHLDEFDSSGARAAADLGAVAVVAERLLPDVRVPQVLVDDARVAWRVLSATVGAAPPKEETVPVVRVAGDCGGDRVATLLASLHAAAGVGVGLLTSRVVDDGEHATRRDPRSKSVAGPWLRRCHLGGVTLAVEHRSPTDRETSTGDPVAVCLTSLRCDGLDPAGRRRWGSVEEHRQAMIESLGLTSGDQPLIANADDPEAMAFAATYPGPLLTYGESAQADLRGVALEDEASTEFLVTRSNDSVCVTAPAPGRAARRDCLAAIATAVALGFDLREAVQGVTATPNPPLHNEAVVCGQPFSVSLDAAMRPKELSDSLDAAMPAGGRRLVALRLATDRRVAAGQLVAAALTADRVFASGDATGLELPGEHVTLTEDRSVAIAVAIGLADPGDSVLVTGCRERPGHHGQWHCPERTTVERLLRRRLACEDRRAAA